MSYHEAELPERYKWMIDLREEDRERCLRIIEETPVEYDANLVTVRIAPIRFRHYLPNTKPGLEVSIQAIVPAAAGIEGLRWEIERLVDEILKGKAKAWGQEKPT